MDTEILQDLGLTQAEIRTYITLLELGNSTAGNILEKSGLQNSVMHRALNSLIEKGIISFINEGKRKVYQATDPEYFYEFIENKKKKFSSLLPQLKKKQVLAKEKKEATIYKGKRGINEVYNIMLNTKTREYNTFGGGKRVTYESMGEFWWKNLHQKRIEKKIKTRQVFDESIRAFGEELNKQKFTRIKFLPQKFEQLTETVICGNKVAVVIFTENPYGLLIEDKEVVKGYKKYFEVLWTKAKD